MDGCGGITDGGMGGMDGSELAMAGPPAQGGPPAPGLETAGIPPPALEATPHPDLQGPVELGPPPLAHWALEMSLDSLKAPGIGEKTRRDPHPDPPWGASPGPEPLGCVQTTKLSRGHQAKLRPATARERKRLVLQETTRC